jgi:predicted nuclease of predicted toxin-antitoxin system
MKFLADENVARRIVEWLRARGDEVLYAAEECAGEVDAEWLRRAEAEGRLLLSSDKDFGELIFRDGLNSHGVILIRLEKLSMDARLERLAQVWSVVQANPAGCFIVITPRRVRVRPLSTR